MYRIASLLILLASLGPGPDSILNASSAICSQEEQEGPTEAEVEAAVKGLKAALKSAEEVALVTAAGEAALVPHDEVVKLLVRVLGVQVSEGSKQSVQRAALQALGQMKLPASLKSLHKAFKKDKALRADQELATALLRAIAVHEDPSSIAVLTTKLSTTESKDVLRARILGLARIRTNESLEALIKLMNRATNKRRVRQMEDFRLALAVLTGTDQGNDATAWMQWWNKAKKSFEVAEQVPSLPKALEARWRRYWGMGSANRRGEKREDRGGD